MEKMDQILERWDSSYNKFRVDKTEMKNKLLKARQIKIRLKK